MDAPRLPPEQKLPVTWEDQTQIAVDCYNAGATLLHIHVRDPKTGHISKNFKEYSDQIGRLRKAVPKMILQVGGSISFAPEPGEEAKFQSYDSRHKLAEIDPKPDQVTVACGTSLYDLTALHPVDDAFEGTRFSNPAMLHAMANLIADSTPDFYIENIKRLVQHEIQPYFALADVHGLELIERLIRKGYYMGPMNGFFSIGAGGVCGANPFDLMELIRRTPHGSFFTYQTTMRLTHPLAAICIALGQHTRAGIEDNLWNTTKGVRMSTIEMIERDVRIAKELGRAIATPEQAHQMLKIGVTYKSTEETLANLGLPPNRKPGNMERPEDCRWSATVYNVDTRALILDRSSRMDLRKNADGSVDIYCGPKTPAGFEKNWIPTVPGKNWFAYSRFYQPTEAYFDRSWPLPDFEQASIDADVQTYGLTPDKRALLHRRLFIAHHIRKCSSRSLVVAHRSGGSPSADHAEPVGQQRSLPVRLNFRYV